jgi:membrane protein
VVPASVADTIRRYAFTRALQRLYVNLDRHNALNAASAMAFDAFLSLVPLAAFAGWLLFRLHRNSAAIATIFGPVLRAAPSPIGDLVSYEFIRLSDAGAMAVAPVSAIGFLWVTSGGLATAMGVFEDMYSTAPRAWWSRRLIAMGFVLVGLAISVAAGTIALMLVSEGVLSTPVAAVVLSNVVVFSLVYAFFRFAIGRGGEERPKRQFLPGAALTFLLWALTSALFSLYVAKLSRYATLYGNLATVAILLFWLWLLSLSLLVGAEVNAMLERRALGSLVPSSPE